MGLVSTKKSMLFFGERKKGKGIFVNCDVFIRGNSFVWDRIFGIFGGWLGIRWLMTRPPVAWWSGGGDACEGGFWLGCLVLLCFEMGLVREHRIVTLIFNFIFWNLVWFESPQLAYKPTFLKCAFQSRGDMFVLVKDSLSMWETCHTWPHSFW